MRIRLATLSDVPAIEDCATKAYAKYVERIGWKPAPMIADFRKRAMDRTVHVAAADDESVLGFIVFFPSRDVMHLENVAVADGQQGKGIGSNLIAFCEEAARTRGFQAVELYTNEKMTENLTLYPWMGYRETDRRREEGFNRVFFRKEL